ncbi:hypothetical protein RSK20926_08262 [Roseobacter sp. SK209-2-6]|nr:hypothetical protein RSK20926_08262 [Roseobacter sp. SK209-2-6]
MFRPEFAVNHLAAIFRFSTRLFNTRKSPVAEQSGISSTRSREMIRPAVKRRLWAEISRPQLISVTCASTLISISPAGVSPLRRKL